jgi:hypothetical protein
VNDFWKNVFSTLGFEETLVAGRQAYKIPSYEAIYLCQTLGTTVWSGKRTSRGEAYVFAGNGEILIFPSSCPSVMVRDITVEIKYLADIVRHQINPLLSPSLGFIQKKHPVFFEKDFKYLMFGLGSGAVEDAAREENISTLDIVSLILPASTQDMGEPLITYIVSSFFRQRGFIVDPFSEALGKGGDLFGFKLPEVQNRLIDRGIARGGFYLSELELLNKTSKTCEFQPQRITETKAVVVEVESPTPKPPNRFSAGKNQLLQRPGYLTSGYFDSGYVAVPFVEEKVKVQGGKPEELGFIPEEGVGIFTLDRKGQILFKECSKEYGTEEKVGELLNDIERVIKLTLLKNRALKQVFNLLPSVASFYDLYFAVDGLNIEDIVSFISQP